MYTLVAGASIPAVANGIPAGANPTGRRESPTTARQAVIYTLGTLPAAVHQGERVRAPPGAIGIDLLEGRGERRPGAPGVYVGGAKVAALGIRVRRGRAYHGLALNVDMDLSPFAAIDPCGYPGLAVTQMKDLGFAKSTDFYGKALAKIMLRNLGDA